MESKDLKDFLEIFATDNAVLSYRLKACELEYKQLLKDKELWQESNIEAARCAVDEFAYTLKKMAINIPNENRDMISVVRVQDIDGILKGLEEERR